jgi:hypothetical protein
MWRDGSGYVIADAEAPTIDGKLDDALYKRAPSIDKFATFGRTMAERITVKDPKTGRDKPGQKVLWTIPRGIVPDEQSTQVWFAADSKNFYMAFRCRDVKMPQAYGRKYRQPSVREKVGNDHPYNWRQWGLDINLDPKNDQINDFHIMVDVLGQITDEYLGWPGDELTTGPPWTMGDNFKVTRDGDNWVFEAAVPLEKMGLEPVKPGDVWGANVLRHGMNVSSFFNFFTGAGPYGIRYPVTFGHVHWK